MGRDDPTYPSGLYWVVTRQLGIIGSNEGDGGDENGGHLHGSVLFLKALVSEELREDEELWERWRNTVQGDGKVTKRERYLQLEILVTLMKRIQLLRDDPMSRWDLEAFEGETLNRLGSERDG